MALTPPKLMMCREMLGQPKGAVKHFKQFFDINEVLSDSLRSLLRKGWRLGGKRSGMICFASILETYGIAMKRLLFVDVL